MHVVVGSCAVRYPVRYKPENSTPEVHIMCALTWSLTIGGIKNRLVLLLYLQLLALYFKIRVAPWISPYLLPMTGEQCVQTTSFMCNLSGEWPSVTQRMLFYQSTFMLWNPSWLHIMAVSSTLVMQQGSFLPSQEVVKNAALCSPQNHTFNISLLMRNWSGMLVFLEPCYFRASSCPNPVLSLKILGNLLYKLATLKLQGGHNFFK